MADVRKDEYLDYEGVEIFWNRIKRRYDGKLDSVTNRDASIRVTNKREIAVNISPAEGNALELKTKAGERGLYVPITKALHKLTFGAGEEYVYDGSEDVTVPVYTGDIE